MTVAETRLTGIRRAIVRLLPHVDGATALEACSFLRASEELHRHQGLAPDEIYRIARAIQLDHPLRFVRGSTEKS